jgi:4-hydroxy-4-methyl-2-oxoglutarate aldolase
MVHIIRSFNRPPETVVKEIAKFSPATLHEAQGRRGALDSRIKPIGSGMRACGPAVTAQCPPGDNLMLQAAISVARPGDVLVVSAGNHTEQGGFGEVLTTACLARGIAGLVTDAGVRDGLAIKKLGFPVFCLGSCMKGTVKETLGTVNQPVVIGGVWVRPGDLVSADDDGVVIVRQEEAAEVAARAREREEKEARFMQALRNGANVLEVLGMDKVLAAKGCTYADQA